MCSNELRALDIMFKGERHNTKHNITFDLDYSLLS
jgi:hypothetical protein